MKKTKPELTKHISLRLNEGTVTAIQKSGQGTSNWLRQAIQSRMGNEQQAATTKNKIEKDIESLKQTVTGLQTEMRKLQQSDAVTQAILADMQKGLGVLEKNQHVLHKMLNDLNQTMRQQFEALGTSLLTDLREQLQETVKVEEEPSAFKIKPVPPRTRL